MRFRTNIERVQSALRAHRLIRMALILEETESKGSYEGKPFELIGTETVVLRLNCGNWQIAHIHWSSRKPKP